MAILQVKDKDGKFINIPSIIGKTGPANNLTIGTVEKGDEANATITGESPFQILNLTLPKGDKGDKGDKGEQGPQGIQGVQGIQGKIGPQGERGPQGIQGATGPANTLKIGNVTKGDNPSASITGTSPNQILNLVLPKGDKGEQGIQGIQGIQGEQGPKGEQGPQGIQGETGNSGVFMGVKTPTDKDINVWIDPTGDTSDYATKEYVDNLIGDIESLLSEV